MKKLVLGVILIVPKLCLCSAILPLPPYIRACRRSDPNIDQCVVESARRAIPELVKGDPVYKLPKMNPLHIDAVELPPISNLHIGMKNVSIEGLENAYFRSAHYNFTIKQIKYEIFIPRTVTTGQYSLKGQLIIFPVNGQGFGNITYINSLFTYIFNFDIIQKKNIQFMAITTYNLTMDCDRGYFKFTNLFSGSKLLADQIDQFMDENWKIVNDDFKPMATEAIGTIAYYTSNAIMSKIPYDELLLP